MTFEKSIYWDNKNFDHEKVKSDLQKKSEN